MSPWKTTWAPWAIHAGVSLASSPAFLSSTARLLHMGSGAGSAETQGKRAARERRQPGTPPLFGVEMPNLCLDIKHTFLSGVGGLPQRAGQQEDAFSQPPFQPIEDTPLTKLPGRFAGLWKEPDPGLGRTGPSLMAWIGTCCTKISG